MSDLPISKVIDFDTPIEWASAKYDSIELREPKMKELSLAYGELKGNDAQAMAKFQMSLVCAVSGAPRQVIENMPISKMNEAFKYLQGFMEVGQETGEI